MPSRVRRFRPARRLRVLLRRRPGVALAWFWMTAFVVTHLPPLLPKGPPEDPPLVGKDKIGHFTGYAILAFLLMNHLTRRLRLAPAIGLSILACAIYGIIDELTQPLFNRTADVADYAADLLGAAIGLCLFLTTRRVWRGRVSPSPTHQ